MEENSEVKQVKTSRPKKKVLKIKDEFFNKETAYVQNGTVKEKSVDWRNLHIGGKKVKVVKGEPLPADVVSAMTKEEKAYWTE